MGGLKGKGARGPSLLLHDMGGGGKGGTASTSNCSRISAHALGCLEGAVMHACTGTGDEFECPCAMH